MDRNSGFYMETKPLVFLQDDKVITAFRECAVFENENGYHTERQMMVDGKRFYVKSIFPSAPKATPTQQMIKLIDSNITKK